MLVKACPSLAPWYMYVLSGCLFRNYLIRSSRVLQVFPFREFSTKLSEHFVSPSFKAQPFVFSFRGNLHVFLVEAGVSDSVLISLSSDDCFPPKKEYSGPFTCFRFNILWHFVSWKEPRLLFSIFTCSFFKRFVFGNSLFQGPFSTFWYDTKKITCISQRVMTLLVQRTSGEDEWLTVKFEHC